MKLERSACWKSTFVGVINTIPYVFHGRLHLPTASRDALNTTGAWPTKLYEFDDTFLPNDFISAYAQIELSAKLGGHDGLTDYVIDGRISWQVTSITGNNGFASYTRTGCKAEAGEKEKLDSWNEAIQRRQDIAAAHVSFVPFSIEAGGVWGPAAQAFFEEAAFYNHYNERDIDRYHWNTAKFKTLWRTKFAVLMARERGRIGSDAALGDMPKRLQAHSYDEMNEGPAR